MTSVEGSDTRLNRFRHWEVMFLSLGRQLRIDWPRLEAVMQRTMMDSPGTGGSDSPTSTTMDVDRVRSEFIETWLWMDAWIGYRERKRRISFS